MNCKRGKHNFRQRHVRPQRYNCPYALLERDLTPNVIHSSAQHRARAGTRKGEEDQGKGRLLLQRIRECLGLLTLPAQTKKQKQNIKTAYNRCTPEKEKDLLTVSRRQE